jgi:transcriptional regulator GlxA family with amidase domain
MRAILDWFAMRRLLAFGCCMIAGAKLPARDGPREADAAGPARELCYRLLTGPHAGMLPRLARPDSHARCIADAIRLMRNDIAHGKSVDELAAIAHLSPSCFYAHFKVAT